MGASSSSNFNDDDFIEVKPTVGDELPTYQKPSFAKANEFYRSTLSHRLRDSKQATGYTLAKPGEMKRGDVVAEDYKFFTTPEKALSEFGIGISLYFQSLKAVFVVILICALISMVAIDENRKHNPTEAVPADCDNDDCQEATPDFLLGSVYGATRDDLKLNKQGASDIAICCVLCIFTIIMAIVEDKAVERADAAQQTTADYSVVVRNPPKDVLDPDVYYNHFKKFGDIVFVTVTKKNGELLQAVAQKKVLEAELTGMLAVRAHHLEKKKKVTTQQDLTPTELFLQSTLGMYRTVEYVERELEKVNALINGLSQKDYLPWRVFITFNSERAHNACLDATNVSSWEVWNNSPENRDAYFEGKTLIVTSTREASDIIWENSHYDKLQKFMSWVVSYSLSFSFVVVSYYIVVALSRTGSIAVALFVSGLNSMLPFITKTITASAEIHSERSGLERSMLLKLVLVRCVNSGLLIYLTADFDQTFRLTHLQSIQNILLFDAFFTPFYRFLDLDGLFNRYVLALGAKTQSELNSLWQGTEWTLAERYTDMLKTVFVGLFFAVPLPSGLFITAIAMINVYLVDKYLLFRVWKRPPLLDGTLSVIARSFFILSVWAHVSISRVYFNNWPYSGIFNSDGGKYEYCYFLFRCDTTDAMTSEQKELVKIYSMAASVTFFIIIVWFFYRNVWSSVQRIFFGWVGGVEAAETDIKFGEVEAIDAFVPVVNRNELTDPILCVDVSNIPYDYLPLPKGYFDIRDDPQLFSIVKHEEFPGIDEGDEASLRALFSIVKYIKPPTPAFPQAPSPSPGPSSGAVGGHTTAPITSQYAQSLLAAAHGGTKSDERIPEGWQVKFTPQGKLYYVDHNTKTTHWTLPSADGPAITGTKDASPLAVAPSKRQVSSSSDYSASAGGSDKSSGSPRAGPATDTGGTGLAGMYNSAVKTAVVLPRGWERKYTANGKVYYVDHNTQTTHWTLPRTAGLGAAPGTDGQRLSQGGRNL